MRPRPVLSGGGGNKRERRDGMILKFDKDKLDSIEPKKLLRNIILVVVGGGVVGYLVRQFLRNIPNLVAGDGFRFEPSLLIKPGTWLMGWLLLFVF